MTLLALEDLTKHFDGLVAVDRVNFEVDEGEIVGVIGPNGSGKTTLINLITGIFAPTGGAVKFAEKSITGLRPHEIARRGIARTFQNIRLFESMSILQNVEVGLDFRLRSSFLDTILGLPRARSEEVRAHREARKILEETRGNLAEISDRAASELPYADKRRLEIARALASRPRVLLLDEPAAGMGAAEIRELVEDIRQLNDQGMTLIVVEHKMRFIQDVTDRVIVLDYGKKIAQGSFDQVKQDPRVIDAYLGGSVSKNA